MKRTKDGGAILELRNGEFVKLNKKEFRKSCMMRDMIRLVLIAMFFTLEAFVGSDFVLSVAVMFIMVGWRMTTGW